MTAQATTENLQAGWDFASQKPFLADISVAARLTTMPRDNLAVTTVIASGVVNYTYFTARRTVKGITRASLVTSVVSATITTQKVGLYSEDAAGNLTLLSASANLVGLFQAADGVDDVTIPAVDVKAGARYALATLFVGTTGPTLLGSGAVGATVDAQMARIWGEAPKMAAQFAGQTDLVASVTNAQAAAYTATPIRVFAELWVA